MLVFDGSQFFKFQFFQRLQMFLEALVVCRRGLEGQLARDILYHTEKQGLSVFERYSEEI